MTASGVVNADRIVELPDSSRGVKAQARVMPGSPTVLSLGKMLGRRLLLYLEAIQDSQVDHPRRQSDKFGIVEARA